MDDSLLADLQHTQISVDVHSTYTPHPHYSLYKQHKDGYVNQEVRRKKILENQKSRRRDFMDYARQIVEGELVEVKGEDQMEEGDGIDEVDMSNASPKVKGKGKKKKKVFPAYRNQIMLSEWLVEVPEDFAEKWIMFVCPIGKRCLVIAARGTTYAYSRDGVCLNNFPSLLPGGCMKTCHQKRDHCILDCIYYASTQTFYVLDVMCWGGHPVYDSDTEFRSFWKATKIRDNAESISKYSRVNPLVFIDLPSYPCTKDSITQVLSQEWPVQVDGLLFIHKEAHYWPRRVPLATWLKAQMVPDILGIPVSPEFLACAPVMSDVTMKSVDGKSAKKPKKTTNSQQASMEVSTIEGDADSTQTMSVEQSEN